MAKAVNLGSVIGPAGQKPQLTEVKDSADITSNRDSKGRILIDSKPIVTGYKFLYFFLSAEAVTHTVNLYIPNSDTFVGQLILRSPDQVETKSFRVLIPTPFNCSITADNISAVRLEHSGYMWT